MGDREASRQLACSIAGKVAGGLALTDQGFRPTVLTLWRGRLRASGRPERTFEAVRMVIDQTGILAGRHRRALDSMLLDDAVATRDTVRQLVGAIRPVRRLVPAAAMVGLGAHDDDHDLGKPACAWDDAEARQQLVSALVADAQAVLATVPAAGLDGEQAEAVGLLALVAGQDVEPGDAEGSWRIARKVASGRVISVVDPQSRHLHKSVRSYRDGDQAHLGRRGRRPHRGVVAGRGGAGAWGCWAAPPMGAARPARRFGLPATPRRSSRSRYGRRCRAASPATTSRSTLRPARSPARPARPWPSLPAAGRSSTGAAAGVRCASAAPAPRTARR